MLWVIIALLLVGVLAFLLLPLTRRSSTTDRNEYDAKVYRDQLGEVDRDLERGVLSQDQAQAARTEIERRLLACISEDGETGSGQTQETSGGKGSLVLIGVLAVALPVGAMSLYLELGSPNVPAFPLNEDRARALAKERAKTAEIEQMIDTLAKRMEEKPGDIRGWQLLGRSYAARQQFDKASYAYGRAYQIDPNPDVTVSYAEALAMDAGGTVIDRARDLFLSILKVDPVNPTARFYLALNKVQRGDVPGALQDWTDLAAMSPQGAPWLRVVNDRIAAAAQQLGIDRDSVKPTAEALRLAKTVMAPPQATVERVAPSGAASGPTRDQVEEAALMSEKERQALVRTMVGRLAAKMKANPGNREGWLRLARAYEVLGKKEKAADARRKAEALAK